MNDTTAPSEPVQPPGVTVHAPITIYNNAPPVAAMPDGPPRSWSALKVVAAVAIGLVLVGVLLGTAMAGGAITLIL